MYVTINMSLCVLRLENIELIELLCTLRAVLEHGTHGRVAVDIGIFTLYVIFLRVFKGKTLVYLHKTGIHLTYTRTLGTVKYEFLRGSCMTALYKDLLYGILNLLDCRSGVSGCLDMIDNLL